MQIVSAFERSANRVATSNREDFISDLGRAQVNKLPAAATLLAVAVLAACSSGSEGGSPSGSYSMPDYAAPAYDSGTDPADLQPTTETPEPTAPSTYNDGTGNYAQTYPIPYSKITCGQYRTEMTPAQRFAFSHDVVIELRAYDQSDRFTRSFAKNVYDACKPAPQIRLAEVAGSLVTMSTADFP